MFEPCFRIYTNGRPTIHRYEDRDYAMNICENTVGAGTNTYALTAKFEAKPLPDAVSRYSYNAPDQIDKDKDTTISDLTL
jgi:hypothetical protein|tara:strand:- start:3071 stop:3310 length:240 start_codon:yes stop_codon:yes gene_type:complete